VIEIVEVRDPVDWIVPSPYPLAQLTPVRLVIAHRHDDASIPVVTIFNVNDVAPDVMLVTVGSMGAAALAAGADTPT
jgi:hypothetical protein